jgi:hypothetical protein
MEYLDNRKDDDYLDTYQEELDYYVAEKQVNNINYTHSCTELKEKAKQLTLTDVVKSVVVDSDKVIKTKPIKIRQVIG